MTAPSSLGKRMAFKWLITIFLPLSLAFIPLTEVYTAQMRNFFIITIMMILVMAFETLPVLIPSVMIPSFYTLFNVAPAKIAFSGWTSTMVMMILGAFVLATVLEDVGLLKRISLWCVLKFGGSLKGIVWGIFLASVIISILTSSNGYILIAAFCFGVCKALNLGLSKESAAIMFAGVLGAGGSMTYVYHPMEVSLMVAAGRTVDPAFNVTWLQYVLHHAPQFLFIVLMVWILTRLYQDDSGAISGTTYFKTEYEKMGAVTQKEKKAAIILGILMIYLMTTGIHGFSVEYGFMFIPYLLFLPGVDCGQPEALFKINYSNLFFVVGCLGIGTVSNALGLGEILSQMARPLLSGMHAYMIYTIVWIFGWVINLLLTPVATLAAFGGPLAQISTDLGIDMRGMLYLLRSTTDQVILPHEQSAYLLFFSFGMIKMTDFIKFMGLKSLLHLIFTLVVFIPWMYLIQVL